MLATNLCLTHAFMENCGSANMMIMMKNCVTIGHVNLLINVNRKVANSNLILSPKIMLKVKLAKGCWIV